MVYAVLSEKSAFGKGTVEEIVSLTTKPAPWADKMMQALESGRAAVARSKVVYGRGSRVLPAPQKTPEQTKADVDAWASRMFAALEAGRKAALRSKVKYGSRSVFDSQRTR